MKNKISIITILTTLLITNIATAQEFYTCIPNDDWVRGKAKEEITDSYIQNEARKVIRDENWVRDIIKKEENEKWKLIEEIKMKDTGKEFEFPGIKQPVLDIKRINIDNYTRYKFTCITSIRRERKYVSFEFEVYDKVFNLSLLKNNTICLSTGIASQKIIKIFPNCLLKLYKKIK